MAAPMIDWTDRSATAWVGARDTRSSVTVEFTGDFDEWGASIWTYSIATPHAAEEGNDLRGPAARTVPEPREMLATCLSFLGACAEAYQYEMQTGRKSENRGLFSDEIAQWAYRFDDELSSLMYELEPDKG